MRIHCVTCGYEGKATTITKGSFFVELFLWCFFIIPGIIYSLWRITAGSYKGCPDCSSSNIIKLKRWKERQERMVA